LKHSKALFIYQHLSPNFSFFGSESAIGFGVGGMLASSHTSGQEIPIQPIPTHLTCHSSWMRSHGLETVYENVEIHVCVPEGKGDEADCAGDFEE
jgi:hypothetical protein